MISRLPAIRLKTNESNFGPRESSGHGRGVTQPELKEASTDSDAQLSVNTPRSSTSDGIRRPDITRQPLRRYGITSQSALQTSFSCCSLAFAGQTFARTVAAGFPQQPFDDRAHVRAILRGVRNDEEIGPWRWEALSEGGDQLSLAY